MTSSNGNILRVTGLCEGNLTVKSHTKASDAEFYIFFDLPVNKRLSKQSWCWWFETPSQPLWCHCNGEQSSQHDIILTIACIARPLFTKKIASYWYRNSSHKPETVARSSQIYNGDSYNRKTVYFSAKRPRCQGCFIIRESKYICLFRLWLFTFMENENYVAVKNMWHDIIVS